MNILTYVGSLKEDSAWGKASLAVKNAFKESIQNQLKESLGAPLSEAATEVATSVTKKVSLEFASRIWNGDSLDKTALGIDAIRDRTMKALKRCQELAEPMLSTGSPRQTPTPPLTSEGSSSKVSSSIESPSSSSPPVITPSSSSNLTGASPTDLMELEMHVNQLKNDYIRVKQGLSNLVETYEELGDKKVRISIPISQFEQEVGPEIEKTDEMLNRILNTLSNSLPIARSPSPSTSPSTSPLPTPPPSPPSSPLTPSLSLSSSLASIPSPTSSTSNSTEDLSLGRLLPSSSSSPTEELERKIEEEAFIELGVREIGTRKAHINRLFEAMHRSLDSVVAITPTTGKVLFEFSQDKGSRLVPSLSPTVRQSVGKMGSTATWLVEFFSRKRYGGSVDNTAVGILSIRYEIINNCRYFLDIIQKGNATSEEIQTIKEKLGRLETLLAQTESGFNNLKNSYENKEASASKIQFQIDNFALQIRHAVNHLKEAIQEASILPTSASSVLPGSLASTPATSSYSSLPSSSGINETGNRSGP